MALKNFLNFFLASNVFKSKVLRRAGQMRLMRGKDLNSDPALLRLRLVKKNEQKWTMTQIGKVTKLSNLERISYLGKLLNSAQEIQSTRNDYLRFLGSEMASKNQTRKTNSTMVINSKKLPIFDAYIKNSKMIELLNNGNSEKIGNTNHN